MSRTAEPDGDEPVDDCLSTAMRQATRRLAAIYDEAMAPLGLNGTQARLVWKIGALQHESGPTGPALGQVASEMGYQLSALTHALRPLERDGLIELAQGEADRRVRHVKLTQRGAALRDRILDLWTGANARIEAALGQEDAARLLALAARIADPSFQAALAGAAKGGTEEGAA